MAEHELTPHESAWVALNEEIGKAMAKVWARPDRETVLDEFAAGRVGIVFTKCGLTITPIAALPDESVPADRPEPGDTPGPTWGMYL
jgi:hypothetical protein